MKNTKFLRTALMLVLAIVIFGSITGGTIAWFTDNVTSTSNIIKSGTLDVEMSYKKEYSSDAEWLEDGWNNADSTAIFDYKFWEPGYTQVRYVKVSNVGDLAFKFKLNVKPSSILGTFDPDTLEFTPTEPTPDYFLEKVIDVYMVPVTDGFTAPTSFADIQAAVGTDYDAPSIWELATSKDPDGAAHGVMLPAEGKGSDNVEASAAQGAIVGEQVFMIALHMQEEAGNEYQNLSIGDGFAIQLEATQYTYEKDDFDHTYDANATYAGLPAAVVVGLSDEEIEASGLPLEAAYMFRTTDTPDVQANPELLNHPYFYWHADFVVTFDKDVAKGSATLAGQYDLWDDDWLAFATPYDLTAGQSIRLLGDVAKEFTNNPIYINYAELCAGIQQFNCGVYDADNANSGTTVTVELRIYETEEPSAENGNSHNVETGRYVTLGSFTYTFE